jgi:hypothetical protein
VAARFRDSDDPLWRADARRNLIHGGALLAAPLLLAASVFWPWLFVALAGSGFALLGRTFRRCAWKAESRTTRVLYALHSHFQHVPILAGQVGYFFDARAGRRRQLIEYKSVKTG